MFCVSFQLESETVLSNILNVNVRTINIRADKEDWTKRKRKGRGGGFEYLTSEIPADILDIALEGSIYATENLKRLDIILLKSTVNLRGVQFKMSQLSRLIEFSIFRLFN